MGSLEIRALVDEFLALIRQGNGARDQDEFALGRLLDALALARHHISFTFDETDYPDPPDWPYEERRAAVCERFPGYGYYNVALPVSQQVGPAELAVGDAIDDIADIVGDLSEIAWAWHNTSEANALWRFENSFDSHWGQDLRDLQRYLHSSKRGS